MSDWKSNKEGGPRAFPANLNITVAPWAADSLRGKGFEVHLRRWMSPANYPVHRLVMSCPGYASFELVLYMMVDREQCFLRIIASSMDMHGGGFGFKDNVNQSVVALNTSRNSHLSYDLDGPDIFLNTILGEEVMVRLMVEKPERPLEGDVTHYLFLEFIQTQNRGKRPDSASQTYHIDFGSV